MQRTQHSLASSIKSTMQPTIEGGDRRRILAQSMLPNLSRLFLGLSFSTGAKNPSSPQAGSRRRPLSQLNQVDPFSPPLPRKKARDEEEEQPPALLSADDLDKLLLSILRYISTEFEKKKPKNDPRLAYRLVVPELDKWNVALYRKEPFYYPSEIQLGTWKENAKFVYNVLKPWAVQKGGEMQRLLETYYGILSKLDDKASEKQFKSLWDTTRAEFVAFYLYAIQPSRGLHLSPDDAPPLKRDGVILAPFWKRDEYGVMGYREALDDPDPRADPELVFPEG